MDIQITIMVQYAFCQFKEAFPKLSACYFAPIILLNTKLLLLHYQYYTLFIQSTFLPTENWKLNFL